VVLNLIR